MPRPFSSSGLRKPFAKGWWLRLSLLVFGLVVIWVILRRQAEDVSVAVAETDRSATEAPEQGVTAAGTPIAPAPVTPGELPNFQDFKKRPLPIARRSATHEWTEGDGRDPQIVQRIAHNEDEFIRLMEENERIIRRQLVYRNDTAAAVIQRSKLAGEPVKRLVLPGLDGKELEFEITGSDLEPSGQVGNLSGHLKDRPTSLVTLAFRFGREAFTIMSPDDGTYLQGDPRESGEIIVASFDPEKYHPEPGGEPIETSEPLKSAE